jgi:hypothetical protein
MRPLAKWPLSQVLASAWGWSAFAVLVAFLTPTGRFLLRLSSTLRAGEAPPVELPVTAIKLWFVLTPLVAFAPPAALIIAWLQARAREETTKRR